MNQKAPSSEAGRAIGDEFDGAGALVAGGLGCGDGGLAHCGAQARAHARRRRLLDDLLVAPLQRAVAFVEMDGVAVPVGEYLHLDVARAVTYFSISTRSSPKADFASRLARGQVLVEIGVAIDAAHALAAAAGHRLDQYGIADLVGLLLEEFRVLHLAVEAGHHRHASFFHQRLGAVLEPHGADRGGRRPDEDDAGVDAGLGKVGILREEAIAGMDAVGARRFSHRDQFIDAQIAVGSGRGTDDVRLVAQPHVQGAGVRRRIDRDGAQAEPPRCAGNAAGDFAAIGDQDGGEHETSASCADTSARAAFPPAFAAGAAAPAPWALTLARELPFQRRLAVRRHLRWRRPAAAAAPHS